MTGLPASPPARGWESTLAPRVVTYLVIASVGLLVGVLVRRVDAVILAAPFALVLVAGLAGARPPRLAVTTTIDGERLVEGDEVLIEVRFSSPATIDRLEVVADLPVGLFAGGPNPVALRMSADRERAWNLPVICHRWGTYAIGALVVRVRDRGGLVTHQLRVAPEVVVRVRPGVETVRTLVRPRRTQAAAGAGVARLAGDGIEPADMRPYVPGDRVRAVNWRMTARRGELWVNQRHPERATDVVVFLDTFSADGLEAAVRVAVTLVQGYLADHDRVGLVAFGGTVSWVRPGMGAAQQYRMVDHLLGTQVRESFVWKGINVVPPHTLPPHALVVAVTSLSDERVVAALADLRNRGIDLCVVDVAPEETRVAAGGTDDDLARRLWVLRRDVIKDRYRRLGVAVVEWRDEVTVESVLAEMQAFRRHGRHALR